MLTYWNELRLGWLPVWFCHLDCMTSTTIPRFDNFYILKYLYLKVAFMARCDLTSFIEISIWHFSLSESQIRVQLSGTMETKWQYCLFTFSKLQWKPDVFHFLLFMVHCKRQYSSLFFYDPWTSAGLPFKQDRRCFKLAFFSWLCEYYSYNKLLCSWCIWQKIKYNKSPLQYRLVKKVFLQPLVFFVLHLIWFVYV